MPVSHVRRLTRRVTWGFLSNLVGVSYRMRILTYPLVSRNSHASPLASIAPNAAPASLAASSAGAEAAAAA